MHFELTNEQRAYLGLEDIHPNWERVILKGDSYRPESVLYFDADIIKRHIISTEDKYEEKQYHDLTKNRDTLLPATAKGKEKKLTASVLESRQPKRVYCYFDNYGRILIGNYNSQTTFYDSWWETRAISNPEPISTFVSTFINTSPPNHLLDIERFKNANRKNVKFKIGDFIAFKISRSEYGFGRVLLNIDQLKKGNIISQGHGLHMIMGKPVLVKMYSYIASNKNVDLNDLLLVNSLPSDYMMDNLLYYGEYEIIGNKPLTAGEFDFPISYGRHIDGRRNSSFFQWGLINVELLFSNFNKYQLADNPFVPEDSPSKKVANPYGYYSIGFRTRYDGQGIKDTISNGGVFNYQNSNGYMANFDLRNPQNQTIRDEIMKAFGLDPLKGYDENCLITGTISTNDLLKKI